MSEVIAFPGTPILRDINSVYEQINSDIEGIDTGLENLVFTTTLYNLQSGKLRVDILLGRKRNPDSNTVSVPEGVDKDTYMYVVDELQAKQKYRGCDFEIVTLRTPRGFDEGLLTSETNYLLINIKE